jgi:hypothetical protein
MGFNQASARWSVVRSTLRSAATSAWRSPSSISLRAWLICWAVSLGLRPNFTPRRCAALTPARVRSLMSAFPFRQNAYHLPHGAAGRRLGVDRFCKRSELHAPAFQVVEHGYQVAQAAARPVELPDNERCRSVPASSNSGAGQGASLPRRKGRHPRKRFCIRLSAGPRAARRGFPA